ncbi:MAG: hypothetical protein EZS28_039099, partial [Streblomastix strix]
MVILIVTQEITVHQQ